MNNSWLERTTLLLGEEKLTLLRNANVLVVGLGGVGAYAAEMIARAGVGKMTIADADTVSESNINRQLIALHSTIGKDKSELMAQRLRDINPEIELQVINRFIKDDETDALLDSQEFDYVVDAIDTVTAKIDLALRCTEMGIPIISSMGTGNKTDPTALKVADIYKTSVCPLARVMRYELKKRGVASLKVVYSEEKPAELNEDAVKRYRELNPDNKKTVPASTSFVPPVAGMIIASEVIKDILEIKK